jgi:hypothetical protein
MHMILSVRQNFHRLAGYFLAKKSGCNMYFYEIEM